MQTFHLRIELGDRVPRVGETVAMQGLAGIYRVKVKYILKWEVHPDDGALLMKVQGTKRLMKEKKVINKK